MNPIHKWCAFAYAYGATRNLVYAPKMKETEYFTDRLGTFIMYTVGSPIMLPAYMIIDIKNIEHIVRKMPGKVDTRPWY